MFNKHYIGIDFSTSHTQIYVRKYGVFYKEPTLICFDSDYKNFTIGNAAIVESRKDQTNTLIHPILESTFDVFLIYYKLILKEIAKRKLLKKATLLLAFSITITEEEKSLILSLSRIYKIKQVYFGDPSLLIAIGSQIDVNSLDPTMALLLGATTSSFLLYQQGKIKIQEELPYSLLELTDQINQYVEFQYQYSLDRSTAQLIKNELSDLTNASEKQLALPNSDIVLTSSEITPFIEEGMNKVIDKIDKILEVLSESTMAKIQQDGVILTGAMCQIPGIEDYLNEHTKLNCKLALNPTSSIMEGMAKVLKNLIQ